MTRVSAPEHPHTHAATMRSPCQSIPMRYMYAKEKREGDYKVIAAWQGNWTGLYRCRKLFLTILGPKP